MARAALWLIALVLLAGAPAVDAADSAGPCRARSDAPGMGVVGSCKAAATEITVIAGDNQSHRCDPGAAQILVIAGNGNEVRC